MSPQDNDRRELLPVASPPAIGGHPIRLMGLTRTNGPGGVSVRLHKETHQLGCTVLCPICGVNSELCFFLNFVRTP